MGSPYIWIESYVRILYGCRVSSVTSNNDIVCFTEIDASTDHQAIYEAAWKDNLELSKISLVIEDIVRAHRKLGDEAMYDLDGFLPMVREDPNRRGKVLFITSHIGHEIARPQTEYQFNQNGSIPW